MRWPNYHYDPSRNPGKPYMLEDGFGFTTSVFGRYIAKPYYKLKQCGELEIYEGYEWDAGTCALDDPAMVVASMGHDIGCELTNSGELDYKHRKAFDALLLEALREYTVAPPNAGIIKKLSTWILRQWRWARWLAVRANSIWEGRKHK